MMFKCGDRVMYGTHGVCQIIGLEKQKAGTKLIEYYVLEPVNQPRSRFYVPTQNEAATSKLHPIISYSDISSLLSSEDMRVDFWIDDESQRKQCYKNLLGSGDRAALIRMIYSLHLRKQLQEKRGKRLHLCDANFLRDAEKLLSSEFALVLGIPQDAVGDYIQNFTSNK